MDFNPYISPISLKTQSKYGEIQVIYGPMFSGKSTELLRRIRRYTAASKNCIILKYHLDTRYDQDNMSTHDLVKWKATPCASLESAVHECNEADVIGVDEAQFFPDVVSFCETMANSGKVVIVACLDGTFKREGFGSVLNLLPIAEKVTKLNAVCVNCHRDAAFTKRIGNETEVEVIGGHDKYVAVCRGCYLDSHKQPVVTESPTKFLRVKQDYHTSV